MNYAYPQQSQPSYPQQPAYYPPVQPQQPAADDTVSSHEELYENDAAPLPEPTPPQTSTDVAAEIRKFKELLDIGAITQEEYDKKKAELLNM